MSLGWKGLLPLSVANIVLTAVVVYLLIPTTEAPDLEATPAAIEQKQGAPPTREAAPEGEQPT
jgi:hypothetical protein